jgi:hypothetical protein
VTKADIILVLIGERRYQVGKWGTGGTDRDPNDTRFREFRGPYGPEEAHETAAFIAFMYDYLEEARAVSREGGGDLATLDVLRKVVALAAACLDQHGGVSWEGLESAYRPPTSVGGFIGELFDYLRLANRAVTREAADDEAIAVLLAFVSLGFALFEQHGVPARGA